MISRINRRNVKEGGRGHEYRWRRLSIMFMRKDLERLRSRCCLSHVFNSTNTNFLLYSFICRHRIHLVCVSTQKVYRNLHTLNGFLDFVE
jgi:hypothetical protein